MKLKASRIGIIRKCKHCYYWSDMIAKAEGSVMTAYCFNRLSNMFQQYTGENSKCKFFKSMLEGGERIDTPNKF